jgi:MoxR-like ATPase
MSDGTFDQHEKLLLITIVSKIAQTEKRWASISIPDDPSSAWIASVFTKASRVIQRKYKRFSSVAMRQRFLADARSALYLRDMQRGWSEAQKLLVLYARLLHAWGWVTSEVLGGVILATNSLPATDKSKIQVFFDVLSRIPFGIWLEPARDIIRITGTLNSSLYGLEKVKAEIMREIILSRHAQGAFRPSPILLCGPPGTGKSAICEVIAKALRLPFFKLGLGGNADILTVKGANITWNMSGPGFFLKALVAAKSQTFVGMLDEIDKCGVSTHGDVIDVVSEILDPEQSHRYIDQYLMDVPLDMSRVLWVATANDLHSVPAYVQDRCHVIEVPPYSDEERRKIIRQFLPNQIRRQWDFPFVIFVNQNVADDIARRTESLRTSKRYLLTLLADALKDRSPGTFKQLRLTRINGAILDDSGRKKPPRIGF